MRSRRPIRREVSKSKEWKERLEHVKGVMEERELLRKRFAPPGARVRRLETVAWIMGEISQFKSTGGGASKLLKNYTFDPRLDEGLTGMDFRIITHLLDKAGVKYALRPIGRGYYLAATGIKK